jgi:hypothetical protein
MIIFLPLLIVLAAQGRDSGSGPSFRCEPSHQWLGLLENILHATDQIDSGGPCKPGSSRLKFLGMYSRMSTQPLSALSESPRFISAFLAHLLLGSAMDHSH